MKLSAYWLAALGLAAVCMGCGQAKDAGSDGAAAGRRLRFAVIPKGTTHEFWKAVHAGADDAAKELGLEIIWKGPLKEDDREQQIKVVEDFAGQRVDGIVLAPLDDTALRPAVDSARSAGIPVVIFDSDLKGENYVSFVATDNLKGGELAGEHLAKLLSSGDWAGVSRKRKVALLRYQEGSASTMNRERGFLDALSRNPAIEVVSSDQYGGATRESAHAASENILARFKNPDGTLGLDGIFCPNESTTFGMLRALQEAGFAGKVFFVGFDSSAKLVDGLKAAQIHGLVLQNPYKMGYEAVKTLAAHIKGQEVAKRIDTGVSLVTPENLGDEASQKLLFPPQK
jgi:ribose transport system substrate-binding protein